jgi:hypothetical protein
MVDFECHSHLYIHHGHDWDWPSFTTRYLPKFGILEGVVEAGGIQEAIASNAECGDHIA